MTDGMTAKQAEAFARSDARRAARGLPPVRPETPQHGAPTATVPAAKPKAKNPDPPSGCCGKEKRSLAQKLKAAILDGPEVALHVMEERRTICNACPHARKVPTTELSQCKKCQCIIHLKTKLADESCPEGKWLAISPTPSPTPGENP